uniref:Uncharacterized protein n=1 Tax=Heliothis virescens TaxID=7102 RepID=A0A2A4K0B9_HELVI
MIYIVCVAAERGARGALSQADPVHCRYGRVLLLIRLGRSAVGISYRSYSGGRGSRPPPGIFIEARGTAHDVKLIITTQTIYYGALTFNERRRAPRGRRGERRGSSPNPNAL